MYSLRIARWGSVVALPVLALALGASPRTAGAGDDILKPGRPVTGAASLSDFGAAEMERLPWGVHVLRANLSKSRAVSIAGAYLMQDDLLCVTATGLVYCMARADLQPRWVSSLNGRVAQPPAEGPSAYAFVIQYADQSYGIDVFAKRNGAQPDGYPARLPFAVSSPPAVGTGEVFVGSLGGVSDAKTLVSYALASGKPNWGYHTKGLVWAAPVFDRSYNVLYVAGEDGRVMAIPTESEQRDEAWISRVTGPVSVTPVATPGFVLVGAQDGTFTALDAATGVRRWMQSVGAPIKGRDKVWAIGRTVTEKRSTGVEGAPDVAVEVYRGLAFARSGEGLFAYELEDGKPVFEESRPLARPILSNGRWLLTADAERTVQFRDAQEGYAVKAQMRLAMFDLIPTNATDGALYGVTHDGGIVAAIPR